MEKNIEKLGLVGQTDVLFGDASTLLGRLEQKRRDFDIIYVDPPYGETLDVQGKQIPYSHYIVTLIDRSPILKPNGSLFIEDAKSVRQPVEGLHSLELKSSRRLGRSMLHEYSKKESI